MNPDPEHTPDPDDFRELEPRIEALPDEDMLALAEAKQADAPRRQTSDEAAAEKAWIEAGAPKPEGHPS